MNRLKKVLWESLDVESEAELDLIYFYRSQIRWNCWPHLKWVLLTHSWAVGSFEFLFETDSGFPKDTGVTLFTLATPGNPLFRSEVGSRRAINWVTQCSLVCCVVCKNATPQTPLTFFLSNRWNFVWFWFQIHIASAPPTQTQEEQTVQFNSVSCIYRILFFPFFFQWVDTLHCLC